MFEEILDREPMRWPKPNDRLLKQSASYRTGARFAEDSLSRECFLWDGYMLAGATLVSEALRNETSAHYLIYPILFNYRHGLEMALKWTLNRYGRFSSVADYDRDHRLDKLWVACKAVIQDVGGDGGDCEAVAAVERIVLEFDRLDRGSFSFRYAQTKNGQNIHLPEMLIDLENVRDVMAGVDNFFTGLDGQLDANSSSGYFDTY
jgi:hypothetical protein